ncbi:MAG: UDP-N-acetylmuramoyl-L-alanyl-D-glutamate--2,6-diaminopimelate ligase [Synergistaceae bacterium]|jgi:UDP-N-acetylmuramoyl-L-alanyl-D-glutamate--2,6-diaminopimelate ligase|nr:UDP-N-acetylmuramoyl-L-alanyl-D-glutamate--2,6-diaminopimelate ligase [Synergistaceae bacterium]
MKLSELFEGLKKYGAPSLIPCGCDPDVTHLEYDSREVSDCGVLFACVPGEHTDGHDFAGTAAARGAAALLCERPLSAEVPQIVMSGVRGAMGFASSLLYGVPSGKLKMAGLTGTNGKTTAAYIIRSILRASGAAAGMMGTVVYDDGRNESPAGHTTPEGPDIQRLLAKMAANGASYCVMEASSHGLEQGRLDGCRFCLAGFSNLTPEHLEFHRDMECYFMAKRKLFTDYMNEDWRGAANADDDYGRRLLDEFAGRLSGYSLTDSGRGDFYTASILRMDIDGMSLGIKTPGGGSYTVDSPLTGSHNASNILESVVLADLLMFDRDTIRLGISACPQVPGRLERYSFSNGVTVFVDFAHSSDGMEKAIGTLRGLIKGRIHVLWGAGGDRTPVKRPVVGELMARLADHVVISTDNPRSESPADIARDVEAGVLRSGSNVRYETILDRGEAIDYILSSAGGGDAVLIAGKGPERCIEYGTYKVPFADSDAVAEWGRSHGLEILP